MVFTVYHSICIFCLPYYIIKPCCSNFRIIIAIFRVYKFLGFLPYVLEKNGHTSIIWSISQPACSNIRAIPVCCLLHARYNAVLPRWKNCNKTIIWATSWQNQQNYCPVWSKSSLSAWRKLRSLATHWAHSEDSGQTGQMPRLIWVFAGRTVSLLVLSWGGSYETTCE